MADARITFHPERRGDVSVAITETHWGYVVREAQAPAGGAILVATAMRFLGLTFVLAACSQWLLPDVLFDAGLPSGRAVLSASLAVCGAALYFLVRTPAREELQVDTDAREFRVARGDGAVGARVLRRIPFTAVEGVELSKDHGPGAVAVFIRLAEDGTMVRAVGGDMRDVERLRHRLCRDLQTPVERVEARLKCAPPRRRLAVRAPMKTSL